MHDYPAEEGDRPRSPSKLSKTPSWILLGFILGALFVWLLPDEAEPAAGGSNPPALRAARPSPPPEPTRVALTTLTTIEAVWETWGEYAVWHNDVTEVALHSSRTQSFSEFYEVRRLGGAYYFRSIPQLARRIITHGKPPPEECPLQFTETEQQYQEWRQFGRSERPAEGRPAPAPATPRPELATPSVPRPTPTVPPPPKFNAAEPKKS